MAAVNTKHETRPDEGRELVSRLLNGPDGLSDSLKLEWRFCFVRWLGILIMLLALPLLALGFERMVAAYLIVASAVLYNATIHAIIQKGGSTRLPYVTALGDALLNISMLLALEGGFDSPFSYFLFAIAVATAMRFGYGPALAVTGLTIGVNLAVEAQTGQPISAATLFRTLFLLLTTLLAGYLREHADQIQAALRDRNQELVDAYSALDQAHQELLSLDRMKTNFLTNVSHELRTPLTSIRSFSEMLVSYDDAATRAEFAQIIREESERLGRLVNDILDIAKIDAGEVEWHFEPVDVRELLEASWRRQQHLARDRGWALSLEMSDSLPQVVGDRDRLLQVVENLLSNAAKFTASGAITLKAEIKLDEVHISVVDTGIGIPPEDREHVFEKFRQVANPLRDKAPGTGLGLAISKEIVERHSGRIWVDSELGVGSTFTFALKAIAVGAQPLPEVAAVS